MENKKYKVVWSAGVNKRTAPTTSAPTAGLPIIPLNTVVDVVQDNIPDSTYPSDVNKLWCKFTDGTYGASIYGAGSVRMLDVTPAPPPVTLPDIKVTVDAGTAYPVTVVTVKPL